MPALASREASAKAPRLATHVLLLLHAGSELLRGFEFYVRRALADGSVAGGCLGLQFDVVHPLLKAYCWPTKLSGHFLHFGGQGFFIRGVFRKMGEFAAPPFLEDVDLSGRQIVVYCQPG